LRLPAVAVISLHQLANLLSSRFYTSFEFYPHAAGAIKALWAWTRASLGHDRRTTARSGSAGNGLKRASIRARQGNNAMPTARRLADNPL